jgi:hypothetical protein
MEIRTKSKEKTSINKVGKALKERKTQFKHSSRLDSLLQQLARPEFK